MFLLSISLSRMALDKECCLNIRIWSRSESHLFSIEDNKLPREVSLEYLKNKYSRSKEKFTNEKEPVRESIRSTFPKSERDDYDAFKKITANTPPNEVVRLKDRKVANDKKSLKYYDRLKKLIFDTEKSGSSSGTAVKQKKDPPSKQLVETKKNILAMINNAFNDDLMDMRHKEIMFQEISSKLHDLTSKNSREVEGRKKRKSPVIEDVIRVKKIKLASSGIEEVYDITPTLSDKVDDIIPFLSDKVVDITPTVFEEVYDITPILSDKVYDITPTLSDTINDITPSLSDTINDITPTLSDKIDDITPILSDNVYDITSTVFEEVYDITPIVFDKVYDITSTLSDKVDDITPPVFEEVYDITPTLSDEVDDITPILFDKVDSITPPVFE